MSIKVMYLNPIGNSDYDQVFADMVAKYKHPETTAYITSLNGDDVSPTMTDLEFRTYESYIINQTVRAARHCATHEFDAMVIGCFYDPALLDAREIAGDTVIVAPCQASIGAALNISNKFSIIIGEWKWEDQMRQTVEEYGYGNHLASFEAVGLRVEQFHQDPTRTKELLKKAALDGIENHRAESIILGCTLEVGFFEELAAFLKQQTGAFVPVIDSSIASFKAAESAALLKQKTGWTNSKLYGMAPPPEEELKKFNILQTDIKFGNVIEVK